MARVCTSSGQRALGARAPLPLIDLMTSLWTTTLSMRLMSWAARKLTTLSARVPIDRIDDCGERAMSSSVLAIVVRFWTSLILSGDLETLDMGGERGLGT